MFDPSRYRGPAAAIAAVGLALAGCSLVVQAAFRERPSWLSGGDSTMEGGQDAVVGRRISGVLAELRRRGKASSDLDLGVVLGSSAVGMAIDPKLLESSEDPRIPARWLSLYANGAHLGDLSGLAELLLGGGLRPRLLVLGLHPGLLARSDDYLSDDVKFDPSPLRQAVKERRLRDAEDEFLLLMSAPLNAAFPERTRIGHNSRVLVIGAKRRMFARLGMGAESLYAPDPDPWTVRLLMPDPEDAPRRAEEAAASASVRELNEGVRLRGLRAGARDKGWFDRANYSTEGYNARSLVAIVREARGRGVEAVVVLLPESSVMRAAVPAEAMDCLRAVLRDAFGPAAPPIVRPARRDPRPDVPRRGP